MAEEPLIRISVRNLVEFILREGDIDDRTTGNMERDAMLQGGRIHRRIQNQMGSSYRMEVPLQIQVPCDGFLLQVEGRADGIVTTEDGMMIDEIKSVVRSLDLIEEPVNVHLAQAKCYAYIYASQEGLDKMQVQITYCHMETEEIKRFSYEFSYEELTKFFEDLVHSYEKWAKFQIEWRKTRNDSIRQISFPFPYREGQRDLAVSVYRSIQRKKKLFIQASTGIGKTMAVLFPAIQAVGEGLGETIFYLTAKTMTRAAAEQAFQILRENGLRYKVITLTAKEKICFCEETQCNPEFCPYAKGHYDRVNDAIFELLTEEEEITRTVLEEKARKFEVCPFEMSLDVSMWMDAVICDYNYVFDPNAHLRRFFAEGGSGEYLFLIDEAHNLVDRGREMYSASIYKEDVMAIRRLVKGEDEKLAKQLEECNKQLLALKKECETYQVLDNASAVALKLLNIYESLERYLDETEPSEKREEVLNFYFQVRAFLNIYDIVDENYVIYTELAEDGRFQLKLLCVNPAVNLSSFLAQGNSTIFFSATLLPIHYYKKLLSVETDDYAVYAESSFPRENQLILMGCDVSSRYTTRGVEMYQRIAEYIRQTVQAKQGNYIVFFPSYRFLQDVYDCFQDLPDLDERLECVAQSQYMGEEAKEIFLEMFEEERDHSLVAFCVMGGVFSEGIDLTNERLIGAIIVGTGIPQVGNEREIIQSYFDEQGMSGFEYAYLYPGMNKVLQSAGRVIRTEEDKGVILLLDDRFARRQYQEIFPREWSQVETCRLEDVSDKLQKFWSEVE